MQADGIFFSYKNYDYFVWYIVLVVFMANGFFALITGLIIDYTSEENHAWLYSMDMFINTIERVNNNSIPDPYLNATVVQYGRFNSSYFIVGYILSSFLANVCMWRYIHGLDELHNINAYIVLFYIFNVCKYGMFAALLAATSQISDPKLLVMMIVALMTCAGYIMYKNDTFSNTRVHRGQIQSNKQEREMTRWLESISTMLVTVFAIVTLSYSTAQPEPARTCDVSTTAVSLLLLLVILFLEARRWNRGTREHYINQLNDLKQLAAEAKPDTVVKLYLKLKDKWINKENNFSIEFIFVTIGLLDSLYTIVSISYAGALSLGNCQVTS
jgi:hypothetical protein